MNKNLLYIDFLATLIQKRVYILAPGPNGFLHWKDIPEDSFVICVNKAIELINEGTVKCQRHLWLVPELSAQQTDWFTKYKEKYCDSLCIGKALIDPGGMKEDEYHKYFNYFGSEPGQGVQLVADKLCTYGTASCMAMQLAYHLGALWIYLVGVDMYGDTYYDGKKGFYEGLRKDTPWHSHINGFNALIRDIKSKGVQIHSLSKTELEV